MLNTLCPGGFAHYLQSVRVVELLEKYPDGLNLSKEVLNGIACHTKGPEASTLEGQVVKYADHIAYINHDIEDAVTAGVLHQQDLPREAVRVLGATKSRRITTLITSLVENSADGVLRMSEEVYAQYEALHSFMYATVYVDKRAKKEEQKVDKLIEELYRYYKEHPGKMPGQFQQIYEEEGPDRAVTDYISGRATSSRSAPSNGCLSPAAGRCSTEGGDNGKKGGMGYGNFIGLYAGALPADRHCRAGERVCAAAPPRPHLYRLCPFHSEKTPSLCGLPRKFQLLLFRLWGGRGRDHLCAQDQQSGLHRGGKTAGFPRRDAAAG